MQYKKKKKKLHTDEWYLLILHIASPCLFHIFVQFDGLQTHFLMEVLKESSHNEPQLLFHTIKITKWQHFWRNKQKNNWQKFARFSHLFHLSLWHAPTVIDDSCGFEARGLVELDEQLSHHVGKVLDYLLAEELLLEQIITTYVDSESRGAV